LTVFSFKFIRINRVKAETSGPVNAAIFQHSGSEWEFELFRVATGRAHGSVTPSSVYLT